MGLGARTSSLRQDKVAGSCEASVATKKPGVQGRAKPVANQAQVQELCLAVQLRLPFCSMGLGDLLCVKSSTRTTSAQSHKSLTVGMNGRRTGPSHFLSKALNLRCLKVSLGNTTGLTTAASLQVKHKQTRQQTSFPRVILILVVLMLVATRGPRIWLIPPRILAQPQSCH